MRLANLAIATLLAGGTACLGSYTPPGGSKSGQQQPPSTPPSGGNGGNGGGGGSGGGSHSSTPAVDGGAPGTPLPTDGGAPAPPPKSTSPSCQALGDCCDLLPTNEAAQCNASLAGLSDSACQAILSGLQQNGVCP